MQRTCLRIGLLLLVCVLGIGSRRFGANLPRFVAEYAGDTLWGLAVFLGFELVLPGASVLGLAMFAMGFSIMVEVSQLYHAPWIDSIRRTTLGGLVLGFDFVWSDLVCYTTGIVLGILIKLNLGGRGQST